MNGATIFFYILAALLVLSSMMVVFLRRVVHSAMALVAALLIMAILFATLQAPMVSILQVLVYAGAIMVLFLFVIMFLNPTALEQRLTAWWSLAGVLGALFAAFLIPLLFEQEPGGNPVASTEMFGTPEVLAKSLFGDFILPFEIASVLLLVAIVGAVVLAKREHRSDGAA